MGCPLNCAECVRALDFPLFGASPNIIDNIRYGPAEGCITTLGRLESKEDANNIGYPLSCRVWVTDPTEHNNLNPIGVPGELLIEGPLVARGYLNNPCLTGRSFVVDPIFIRTHGFSTGRRMYRTGDFVRQDWNGALQHLGRIDSQIKIHGQRVEPGEVEYWVKTLCDDVEKASLNLIHPGGDHAKTMLAVAVELSNKSQLYKSTDGVLPLNDELRILLDGMRSALPEKLPAYMVPGVYVPVGKIPQTTSSKVDRRGLCAMLENLGEEQLALYSLGTSVKHAPSTRMEKKLQELWATSLGVSQKSIGVKDDFFRSGGDSLIAMQLVGYCSSNIPLTISDIFKNPRLDRMAALAEEKNSLKTQSDPSLQDLPFTLCPDLCDKRLAEIAEECGVTIDQIEDVYPCTPLQEGLFTVTMRRPHAYMFRQVFRLCSMDIGHFQDAWQVVSQRVPILRTVLVSDDNLCFLQVVLRSPLIWVSGFSLDAYLVSDKKMSIETGRPLSRYAIIEQNEEEKYFIWTAHHSVYDGITLRKIFEMVAQAYMIGNVTLSAVPFKRFVAHLQTPVSGQVRSFWRSQLNGGALAYPQASRIREVRVTERLFNRIRITSGSLPITLSNILRAAWAIVLSRTTRHECIIFGTTLSGRFAPILGIADIVGPTISTVPIQIKVGRQMTVNEYLISVHQQSVDMMAFEYTGLQYIRRLVSPASNLPDLGNLFVVQFPQEQDELMAGFMPGLVPHSVASQEFDSYPLNVFCNLNISKGRAINVEARFDNSIISAEEVDSLMGQLGVVVNHLIKLPPDTKLRDIASISPTKFRSVHGGLGINNLGRLEADGGLQNSSGRYEVTRPTGSQIEKDILAICTSVMGLSTDNTPLERSFSNLGGDSFMAMQLVMRFRRRGIPITVQDIIRSRSITELASSVELLQRSATYTPPRALEEEIDWHGEAAITRLPELSKTHSNGLLEIVLTGSTGFLGHHILGELVAAPLVARIHCIAVRPQGLGSARNLPTISKKIFTYSGDLTLPLLGLSEQHYELFSTCSAIIHCGAHVSFVQPYQALQKANVESTKILADFAVQHKIPFHFISTLGVTHLSRQEIFGEVSVAAHPPNNSGDGYVASKWVSEVFLENINRETGLPVYIYRPSAIVGPGAPTLDIANNLLNFSRKIQSVPDISNWNGRLDCVDITAVATNISRTVLQDSLSRARGVVYYHESGQLVIPYSGMKQYLEREGLVKLKEVSLCEWIALALGSGMHPSVGEYLETSAQKVIEAHPMPLCDTSRDYTDFGRIRV